MIDLSSLPDDPGCYLFKDATGSIIYIGKAKNLKKRIRSYFQTRDHDTKTTLLIAHIDDIDLIVTNTEVEALILENNLIKKHQPQYNIDLKDAKSYAFIQLSDEEFPRISIARYRGGKKNGTLFGPFVSAGERDRIFYLIKKTFRLRSCRRMKKRPCLRYHIGNCSGPCQGAISYQEYQYQVKKAEMLLKGKNTELVSELRTDMEISSQNLDFERAMQIRDQITAIQHLTNRQNIQRQNEALEHVINFIVRDGIVYLLLFTVEKGTLASKEEYVFKETPEFFDEFFVQYYGENTPPKEIIIPVMPQDTSMDAYLSHQRGTKVLLTVPKQGIKLQLLRLVIKNIEASLLVKYLRLTELKEVLDLNDIPRVIECFDVSHLSGTGMVGSMVRFTNGKPDKTHYRRFRLRETNGIDDVAGIAELVRRRYTRLKNEDADYPDLIIVDGGKGQLSAAERELTHLELTIPLVSIAKREEEIYKPGRNLPLSVPALAPASLLVQEIRDEAHRFAISYQRQTRKEHIH